MGLYPSITITHNVSPETLYCHCCNGNKKGGVHKVPSEDYYYCKKHKGFVPKTLRQLVKKRSEVKEKMKNKDPKSKDYKILNSRQYALKILANASYGYYGYAGSRWYSRVCAESITAWGRYYIQKVIRKAEKLGKEVIYGDTDSLFIKVKTVDDAGKFLDAINKSLPGVMELEFKGIYKTGLFVPAKTGLAAKKRYALLDSEDNMTIRGFEHVRRDWSPIARDTQKLVLNAVLLEDSPEKAIRIARKAIGKIEKGNVNTKKLVIHTQLAKSLTDYEQKGPHVVAARKALSRGKKISEGSLISYIITPGTGTISERAEPAEDAESYDPEYYINNQVLPAVMRVLAGLGYSEEDVTGEEEGQSSLDKFIKKSIKGRIRNRLGKLRKK
jgi:DNA polymerase Pol2